MKSEIGELSARVKQGRKIENLPTEIEIEDARNAQAIVRNLFIPYMHDLSDAAGIDVGEDGAFSVPASLSRWWEEPATRHPLLVRTGGKLAGFALVRQLPADNPTHDMGEFFILRKYRRAGVGRQFAFQLFDRFAGKWEVRELLANTPAQAFWRRIIGEYTAGDFEDRREFFASYGREFVVQRFRSPRSTARG